MYTSEELESVSLYGRFNGLKTYREIRDALAGDRGEEARKLLNLDHPRHQPGQKVVKLRRGVPSEATLCRHRTWASRTSRDREKSVAAARRSA